MGIPETQLEIWSHRGAVTTAKCTHESIRSALDYYEWPDDVNFEVYLQGSYKNDTNIRGDMDVDVVIQLNSTFSDNLSEEQRQKFGFTRAGYTWKDFRQDILKVLRDCYGGDKISEGNKAIKAQTLYLPADVVVCIQYRQYPSDPVYDSNFVEGMTFWTRNENWQVINYPKLHYKNGVAKQKSTSGWYKKTVRMFKNVRNYLEENHYIPDSSVPSYFLECLLYNVPDRKFGGSFGSTFYNVVSWFAGTRFDGFICQNKQLLLFGGTPEQWSIDSADKFVQNLAKLWGDW